jgi:hypothetical protein
MVVINGAIARYPDTEVDQAYAAIVVMVVVVVGVVRVRQTHGVFVNSDIFEFSQLDMCTAEEDDDGRKDMVIWIRCAKDRPGKDWMTDMASQGRLSVCKSGPSSGLGSKRDQLFG